MMPNGQHTAKKKTSPPRIIGMIAFRALAAIAWLFALLFVVAGFKVNLLGLIFGIIVAVALAFVGLVLWIIGDMIKDPEEFKRKQAKTATEKTEGSIAGITGQADARTILDSTASAVDLPEEPFVAGAAGFHAEKSSDDHIRNESGDHPDADYIVLDLETTGFSPKTCGIIDIGIVYVKNDESIGEYSQLINPGILIPPEITNLTGVDDDMLKEQPRIVDVIHELRRRIGDLPILGHNIQFDIGFLNQAFQDAGLPNLGNETFDTADLSREKYPTATSHTLQDVMRRTGINKTEEHRALADAKDTLECYKRLKAITAPQQVSDDDEQITLRQKRQKTQTVFRSRHMANAGIELRNEKPYGIVIPSKGGVEIVGEEEHQDKLNEYGAGAWFWVELQRGENPKGTHMGEPTILVTLDGEQIGWMTPTNTSRHYHQVPKIGGVALAHTKSGKTAAVKLDVRVEMPEAETPSEEYKTALAESRLMTQNKSPMASQTQQGALTSQKARAAGEDAETNMSTWGTANKMPHKKDITGPKRTPIKLNDNASETLDQYEDGTLLWALLRKTVVDGMLGVQVKIGRKQIGTLDLTDNAACLDLITDNGAMSKIEIGTQGGLRTATALIR